MSSYFSGHKECFGVTNEEDEDLFNVEHDYNTVYKKKFEEVEAPQRQQPQKFSL